MAESFSREKLRHIAEGRWMRNPVWPSSCVTPAGKSNELDVQNKWEENTHTHTPVVRTIKLGHENKTRNAISLQLLLLITSSKYKEHS